MVQEKAETFLVSLTKGALTGLFVLYIGQKAIPSMALDISPEPPGKLPTSSRELSSLSLPPRARCAEGRAARGHLAEIGADSYTDLQLRLSSETIVFLALCSHRKICAVWVALYDQMTSAGIAPPAL